MSRNGIAGVGLAAAAVGVLVGYGLGRSPQVAPPATPARDAEVQVALAEVAERLAAVERALGERAMGERATLVREPAAPTDTEAAVSPFDAEALVERLAAITRDLAVLRADRNHEELRRTREQFPQTNEAAVRAVYAAVAAEAEMPEAQRTTQRDWRLRTMAEVVARLGVPNDVYTGGEAGPLWAYRFDEEELLVAFRDGLVVELRR